MRRIEEQVTEIQISYPRIYMACHTEHVKARTSQTRLSSRDSSILAHLTDRQFTSPAKLAKHLNITPSTLSEAIQDLVELGYVKTRPNSDDSRKSELKLTDKGLEAMKRASVLDADKIALVLRRLSPEKREKVVEGLKLLAEAASESK